MKFFKDFGGINGKINIQKVIFSYQIANLLNFHYKFDIGYFGPFSEELEQDLIYLCELGLFIEEPNGRIRVKDKITNKSFFNKYTDFLSLFENNKLLEYRIIEMMERDLQSTGRIELAGSLLYLILNKEIHEKEDLFDAIDRWKPGDFTPEDKEDVWDIIVNNKIINEKGELVIPIRKDKATKEMLENFVYIDNPDLYSSNLSTDFVRFDDMLNIIHNNDSFWDKIVKKIVTRTECKYWDFKQWLEMWKVSGSLKQLKQIDFCEKIAAFANRNGGIVIIGITDKLPRKILGVSNLENKLQSITLILEKWLEYHEEFFNLEEIILKDSDGIEKRCIAVIVAQTNVPIAVKTLNGYYSYPVRVETGLTRVNFSTLRKKKKIITTTNFNFLNLLNNGK